MVIGYLKCFVLWLPNYESILSLREGPPCELSDRPSKCVCRHSGTFSVSLISESKCEGTSACTHSAAHVGLLANLCTRISVALMVHEKTDWCVKRVTCCSPYLESHRKLNTVHPPCSIQRGQARLPFPHSSLILTFLCVYYLVPPVVDENTEQDLNKNEKRSDKEIAHVLKDYLLLEVM